MPIEIDVPGFGSLKISHLVCDYNGTLACDGRLLQGVGEVLEKLSRFLTIHVVTADTFGRASKELEGLPLRLTILGNGHEREAKARLVSSLEGGVVAIGNGANDLSMMEAADLAIAVMECEGLYAPLLSKCHIVVRRALDALGLLLEPARIKATLRF